MDIQKERVNFQPKIGEKYWYISAENECGYTWSFWTDNPVHNFVSQFGVYRTKAEIKPIVALIRKITRNQESFVLVPVKETSDWYLDDSESMYLEEMNHWACEIEVGEVVTVERKKIWDIPDQYVAKVYVDENNIEWQLFDDEASAQKAADHCKTMILNDKEEAAITFGKMIEATEEI
jgi:hypothetical protein